MLGQGQLYDIPVYILVCIQFGHLCQQLLFTGILREVDQGGFKAYFLAGAHFASDIGQARPVISHKDCRQMGYLFAPLFHPLHQEGDFFLNLIRYFFPVKDFHRVRWVFIIGRSVCWPVLPISCSASSASSAFRPHPASSSSSCSFGRTVSEADSLPVWRSHSLRQCVFYGWRSEARAWNALPGSSNG